MSINKGVIIKIGVLIFIASAFIFIEPLRSGLGNMISAFTNQESVRDYIKSFGVWAVAVSFLMMVLQSVAAPIPAFFVTLANGMIWGWGWGALLSWSSAMAGAALCFFISRFYGRGIAEKFISKTALDGVDDFFEKYGKNAILVARLLPFMPFDPISYAAGLTAMGFWSFFIATGLGQLPATIVYSYAAEKLGSGNIGGLAKGLLIMFGVAALGFFIKKLWANRSKKQGINESRKTAEQIKE